MNITIRSRGYRDHSTGVLLHTVVVLIDGVEFTTYCQTAERANELVLTTARALGLQGTA